MSLQQSLTGEPLTLTHSIISKPPELIIHLEFFHFIILFFKKLFHLHLFEQSFKLNISKQKKIIAEKNIFPPYYSNSDKKFTKILSTNRNYVITYSTFTKAPRQLQGKMRMARLIVYKIISCIIQKRSYIRLKGKLLLVVDENGGNAPYTHTKEMQLIKRKILELESFKAT